MSIAKMRIFSTFIFILFLSCGTANACICPSMDKEDILAKAQFIGVVAIESAEVIAHEQIRADDNDKASKIINMAMKPWDSYRLIPLRTFKGEIPKGVNIYSGGSNCDFPKAEVNEIYRVIIFKNANNDLHLSGRCAVLKDEIWTEFEEKNPRTVNLTEFEKKCKSDYGVMRFIENKADCYYKSSDFGKNCLNSTECEGFCDAMLTKEERVTFAEAKERLQKNGQCNEWKNDSYCLYSVETGEVEYFGCRPKYKMPWE